MIARRSFLTRVFALGGLAVDRASLLADEPPRSQRDAPQAAVAIHEAFAEVLMGDPAPGPAAPDEPPAALRETPAEVSPAVSRVVWLPGYWSWDDGRQAFVWMSGVWRFPPPGMRWIPGYWMKSGDRYRRVAGLWVPATQTRLEYLPPPPARRPDGDTPAPSADHVYIPGGWQYRGDTYVWRAGYWSRLRANWTWVAAHYVWTPSGVVYSSGYWDFPLIKRGLPFAPAAFDGTQPVQANTPYTPSDALNPATQTTLPVKQLLGQAQAWPWPLAATTDEARAQARLLAEHLQQLTALRRRFEGVATRPPRVLVLPALPDALASVFSQPRRPQTDKTAREGGRVPGIVGRELPGVGGRNVPGVKGREVPGAGESGAAPRGVLPGVGRGAPLGGEDIVVPGVK